MANGPSFDCDSPIERKCLGHNRETWDIDTMWGGTDTMISVACSASACLLRLRYTGKEQQAEAA